jgi:two-component system phosphate regulon response regulator PhoB
MAKIVLAEDETSIAELIKLKLSEAGHQVSIAPDGPTATRIVSRESPALIILDYNLPLASGADVHKALRRNDSTALTPIIFLTSASLPDVMTSVADDEKTRFLEKPVDFPFLTRTISDLLSA